MCFCKRRDLASPLVSDYASTAVSPLLTHFPYDAFSQRGLDLPAEDAGPARVRREASEFVSARAMVQLLRVQEDLRKSNWEELKEAPTEGVAEGVGKLTGARVQEPAELLVDDRSGVPTENLAVEMIGKATVELVDKPPEKPTP